jgi:hypothetical protein
MSRRLADMSRRRVRRWVTWLLPLLVARMLVPAGFMVSTAGGSFDVVLCSGFAALPASVHLGAAHTHHGGAEHATHATHAPHGETAPGGQPVSDSDHYQPACAFALASTGFNFHADKAAPELLTPVTALPGIGAEPAWNSRTVLIDRIRGPPLA